MSNTTEGDTGHQTTVPLEALTAEREKRQQLERDVQSLKVSLASVTGQVSGMQTSANQQTQKRDEPVYTREQLDNLVDEGKMTRHQADQTYEAQLLAKITNTVAGVVDERLTQNQVVTSVTSTFDGFLETIPEIAQAGTPEYRKVAAEFKRLRELGMPDNKSTEVVAMEQAFGKLDVVKRSRGGDAPPQTHQETGGGYSRGESQPQSTGDGPPEGMSASRKAFYQDQISKGMYPNGWKDVREELKYSDPSMLKRADARG